MTLRGGQLYLKSRHVYLVHAGLANDLDSLGRVGPAILLVVTGVHDVGSVMSTSCVARADRGGAIFCSGIITGGDPLENYCREEDYDSRLEWSLVFPVCVGDSGEAKTANGEA
jgi:hypothetical protein